MRKLFLLLLVSVTFAGSAYVQADPAEVIYFNSTNACFDEFGNALVTDTIRRMVITNDDEGTINLVANGE